MKTLLFGKTFGIGNAIMAIPAIKALNGLGYDVDVICGRTSDDVGAFEVFSELKESLFVKNIWINKSPQKYDIAIMSIPFDGRWQNGVHFEAAQVMDGRTRPDPTTTGLISWKKHEIEYQMDNTYALGYRGPVPDCEFFEREKFGRCLRDSYLGIGYKKDAAGFWKVKHWGNENYAELVKRILAEHPANRVITSGDMADLQLSINPIMRLVNDTRFQYRPGGIQESFETVRRCGMYVGNDTGMMHVAASMNLSVCALFFLENSIVKSRPWCDETDCLDGATRTLTVDEVFEKYIKLRRR